MPFSRRIGIIFTIIILLTMLAASINWVGTTASIRRQNEIIVFSSELKKDFYRLASEEKAFSIDMLPLTSHNVFSIIELIRSRVLKEIQSPSSQDQTQSLQNLLQQLDEYEKMFLLYTSDLFEFQTLESRLNKELEKMLSLSRTLIRNDYDFAQTMYDNISQLLLYHSHIVSVSPEPQYLSVIKDQLSNLSQYLKDHSIDLKLPPNRLSTFRFVRSVKTYSALIDEFHFAQQQLSRQTQLRTDQLNVLKLNIEHYISTESSQVEQKSFNFLLFAIVVSCLLAFIAICAVFYLSGLIVRPIEILKESAHQVVHGNLDTSVAITSNDEIGQLSQIFNQMTKKLKSSFSDLEIYQSHLEDLVDKRTTELEQKIAEKEIAEKAIIASQKNIQRIIDQTPVGIILWDEHFHVLQWNPASQNIFGYSSEEAIGKHAEFIVSSESKKHVQNVFIDISKKKHEVRSSNHNITKEGKTILCDWYNTPFLNHENELTGIISIVEDITAKDRREKELLKIAKLEAAGILAGGIAHDFNNILTAILGNISLANIDTNLNPKTRSLLSASEKAAVRAKSLTEQLLTFAKGGHPVKETTTLRDIIIDSAAFVLHGGNVSITYNFAENVWAVDVDKGQFSQVIQNIILNSRHSMPKGGNIHIQLENFINTSLLDEIPHKHCIKLSIQDEGIGMSQDIVEKIFDPYFTTKQEGSGLGLAVAHSIIQKHDGHILVDSELGKGTIFSIYLPASEKSTLSLDKEVSSVQDIAPCKILVMDDEEMVREVLTKMLQLLGHSVLTCEEGKTCINLFKEAMTDAPFDIVIMDLTIPGGLGGRETVKEILQLMPTAKVIVASGYSNDPIMSTYSEYGFVAALTKPFTATEVNNVIIKVQSLTS